MSLNGFIVVASFSNICSENGLNLLLYFRPYLPCHLCAGRLVRPYFRLPNQHHPLRCQSLLLLCHQFNTVKNLPILHCLFRIASLEQVLPRHRLSLLLPHLSTDLPILLHQPSLRCHPRFDLLPSCHRTQNARTLRSHLLLPLSHPTSSHRHHVHPLLWLNPRLHLLRSP